MRIHRLVEDNPRSYYHCVSRVVDGRYIFEDEEKRFFRMIMRGLEHLTGVRILHYFLMSNHFHFLVEVLADAEIRPSEEVSDKELVSSQELAMVGGRPDAGSLMTRRLRCLSPADDSPCGRRFGA